MLGLEFIANVACGGDPASVHCHHEACGRTVPPDRPSRTTNQSAERLEVILQCELELSLIVGAESQGRDPAEIRQVVEVQNT